MEILDFHIIPKIGIIPNIYIEAYIRQSMVTDDELYAIKRMRSSGHTHQEIADSLSLKRSTVAYQLKKLKDSPEDHSIEIVHASGFEPKETLIEFDNHGFESHRVKTTLYTTGRDIFEMRGGVIHKTRIRKPFTGSDYPVISQLMRVHGPNWCYNVNEFSRWIIEKQRQLFTINNSLIVQSKIVGLIDYTNFIKKYVSKANERAFDGIPDIPGMIAISKDGKIESEFQVKKGTESQIEILKYLHNIDSKYMTMLQIKEKIQDKINHEDKILNRSIGFGNLFSGINMRHLEPTGSTGKARSLADNNLAMANSQISEKLANGFPNIMVAYYKEKGFKKDDLFIVWDQKIETPELLQEIRDSGAESKNQYEEMQGHGISFESYQQFKKSRDLVKVIFPRDDIPVSEKQRNIDEGIKSGVMFASKKKNFGQGGYDSSGNLLISPTKLSLVEKLDTRIIAKYRRAGLSLIQILDDGDFTRIANFLESSRGVGVTKTNYNWVKKQTPQALKNFSRFPSPRAALLFDAIAMSPTQNMLLESLIQSHNVHGVPGSTINDAKDIHEILQHPPFTDICISNLVGGFVEKYADGKPLLDSSKFIDLNGNNSTFNKKVIAAINRNSVDDSLTAAWTRFEKSSETLWKSELDEPLPTNGQVAVRIIDEMAKLVKFTPALVRDLHLARQLRNDVIHGSEPREELKPKHVRRVLEATEKIITKISAD